MDKKHLICFYIFLMIFVSSVAYLDILGSVTLGSILYINIAAGILFIFYIIFEYASKKRYYSQINDIIRNNQEDMVNRLPEPGTNEEELFNNLISSMHNKQNEKIEEFHEEKREYQEFINIWVHEVKTPISVMRLLIENNCEAASPETLYSIGEETDKIEAQVEQALYYSKIDDFSKDYFINEIELDKTVREAVKRNARIFINKKIKVLIDDINLTALTDKKWLLFIINQILSNSLKYTDNDGSIHIWGQEDEKEKRLIIEDNGIGIRTEDIHRVFERGFTGLTGRQHLKSTGMGLYLSKRLAGKLGHDITIESEEGKYTRVVIHIPKISNYINVTKM